ncbi:MAG TPA: hypothetical protein VHX15_08465 [Frankiaceae bacterium]|jgi:hypothetical protein|nr:hypothetical protein [Frankiaceae bacterium]
MAAGCTPPKPYSECGSIDTAPNSDVGVFEIQAHGPDCATAKTVADKAYLQGGGQPFTYGSWVCTGAIPSGGLGSYVWCNGTNGTVITWRQV